MAKQKEQGTVPVEKWVPHYPDETATAELQGTPYDELTPEQQAEADEAFAKRDAGKGEEDGG